MSTRTALTGTLTFFCGKMGAGKSTMAAQIAAQEKALLISEDDWLATLFPDEIGTLEDYATRSERLRPVAKSVTQQCLMNGQDVVMDFPANTLSQRRWLKSLASDISCKHRLIYIDVSDEVCLARIRRRLENDPTRRATDTEQMFHAVSRHFLPPQREEGMVLISAEDYSAGSSAVQRK
jgi:predicted kinase